MKSDLLRSHGDLELRSIIEVDLLRSTDTCLRNSSGPRAEP